MDSLAALVIALVVGVIVFQVYVIVTQAREYRKLERELTTWRMDGETWLHHQKEDRKRIEELEAQSRALRVQLLSAQTVVQSRENETARFKEEARQMNQQVLTLERQLQAFAERVRPVKKRRLQ